MKTPDKLFRGEFAFKACKTNTGVVTYQQGKKPITLKKNGVPIKAGDLKEGEAVTFNKHTGEIYDNE
jgi:hypothetical protein